MSEHDEQTALFLWASIYQESIPGIEMMFAVPNGGYRLAKTAKDLKEEGVKAGVPDVWLPVCGIYEDKWVMGLVIEMKYGRNNPTPEQVWWLDQLAKKGWRTVVCYSWRAAARAICEHFLIDFQSVGLEIVDI
jgi:hypothetical protein